MYTKKQADGHYLSVFCHLGYSLDNMRNLTGRWLLFDTFKVSVGDKGHIITCYSFAYMGL